MCPVSIQLECEERMTTPIDRLDHIEQGLDRMRPTMAYEVHGAAAIRQELAALREIFSRLARNMEALALTNREPFRCPGCPYPAALEEMIRAALNGDTCG
jgi:TPP-dependent indolepyruvate ferredoxin oxidoreductase alpha subunit